ncbi:MAG: hypothetical protein M1831_004021 [Alyxoria varia]|nr:MAG: hypothetical protein M1831_004021 [Alyxoria varia]
MVNNYADPNPLTFVGSALPDLQVLPPGPNGIGGHTSASSLRHYYYLGPLGRWASFKEEAVQYVNGFVGSSRSGVPWPDDLKEGVAPLRLRREVVACGDEATLVGRFVNNALIPANDAVDQTRRRTGNHTKVWVGDRSISTLDPTHVVPPPGMPTDTTHPDILFCNSEGTPRCAGELKTFWTIGDLTQAREYYRTQRRDGTFGRILGQVAGYMQRLQVRYGFISTYEETMAVKAEYLPDEEKWCLYVSDVIHSGVYSNKTTAYNHPGRYQHITAQTSQGTCSTKEAMLYLMLKCGESPGLEPGLGTRNRNRDRWIQDMGAEPTNPSQGMRSKRGHPPPPGSAKPTEPGSSNRDWAREVPYHPSNTSPPKTTNGAYKAHHEPSSKFINRTGPEGLEIWYFKYSDRKHKKLEFFNPYLGEWVDRKLSDLEKYCQLSLDKRYGYYKLYSGQVGRSVWLQEVTSTRR